MKKRFCLRNNRDIEKLVKLKKSVGNRYYVIYYNSSDDTKIAISVSKKVGNAVVRNYQKRTVREIISKNLNYVLNKHVLIVIKKNCLDISFKEKEMKLKSLILQLKKGD